ncbi:unnamed protein product [Ostreobium quekettii]|uniref:Protein kinase domain-containing protein n=1 Tax=Ostreobium quekettii TaxID=121088 RepID=A0A8S1J4Y3_9CHLO|nr:unnamed protein product [Ostreobium quekettii]
MTSLDAIKELLNMADGVVLDATKNPNIKQNRKKMIARGVEEFQGAVVKMQESKGAECDKLLAVREAKPKLHRATTMLKKIDTRAMQCFCGFGSTTIFWRMTKSGRAQAEACEMLKLATQGIESRLVAMDKNEEIRDEEDECSTSTTSSETSERARSVYASQDEQDMNVLSSSGSNYSTLRGVCNPPRQASVPVCRVPSPAHQKKQQRSATDYFRRNRYRAHGASFLRQVRSLCPLFCTAAKRQGLQHFGDRRDFNMEPSVHATIYKILDLVPRARYCRSMAQFLKDQIRKIQYPKVLHEAELWRILQKCDRLVSKLSSSMDLQAFTSLYLVEEVKEIMERLCYNLHDHMLACGLEAPTVVTTIPADILSEDRQFLDLHLAYLLDVAVDGSSIGESSLPLAEHVGEWRSLKETIGDAIHGLVVADDEILFAGTQLGDTHKNTVWEGVFRGQPVAVKKRKEKDNKDVSMENLAQFYSEVILQARIQHPHVAKILAITKYGTLVMPLADGDLEWWYKEEQAGICHSKIAMLYQAALGLRQVHDKSLVHCDIKPRNFLVFKNVGDGQLSVQLSDFGIATKQRESWMKTTCRPQPGTTRYLAPEIDDGKAHSAASDVFSFGLVINEVLAGSLPYHNGSTEVHIWKMKSRGKSPCSIPRNCPENLRSLMRQCRSEDPSSRPSMEDVVNVLNGLRN